MKSKKKTTTKKKITAKKTTKKPSAKKTTKKATTKKIAKKTTKKPVAKKTTKKTAKKPVTKKSTKKTVKKPATKKATKKITKTPQKKTTAKKTTKKTVKKPIKKVTKKKTTTKKIIAKKTTTKKPIKAKAKKAPKTPKKPHPKKPAKTPQKQQEKPSASPKTENSLLDDLRAKINDKKLNFKIGDHAIYPSHGIGKIIEIEKITALGQDFSCYLMYFEKEKLTIKVPVANAQKIGLRPLVSKSQMDEVFQILRSGIKKMKGMWSRRAQEYEAKINSGDIISLAEVLRDLARDVEDGDRSYSERIIYETAVLRLAAEYAVIHKTDIEEAKESVINAAKDKLSTDLKIIAKPDDFEDDFDDEDEDEDEDNEDEDEDELEDLDDDFDDDFDDD